MILTLVTGGSNINPHGRGHFHSLTNQKLLADKPFKKVCRELQPFDTQRNRDHAYRDQCRPYRALFAHNPQHCKSHGQGDCWQGNEETGGRPHLEISNQGITHNPNANPNKPCNWFRRWNRVVAQKSSHRICDYSIPSTFRPVSEIICGVHCGSHTMCTFADSTVGRVAIFERASSAMTGPMPQPGAVSVIFTSTV